MDRIPLLDGDFAETNLQDLLEMLSLSRQLSVVEIVSPLGAPEGTLWLKSGQLIDVTAGERVGLDAVEYLLDRPGRYTVFRIQGVFDPATRPLMSLPELIEYVSAARAARGRTHGTGLQPKVTLSQEPTTAGAQVSPAPSATPPPWQMPAAEAANRHSEVPAPAPASVPVPAPASVPAPAPASVPVPAPAASPVAPFAATTAMPAARNPVPVPSPSPAASAPAAPPTARSAPVVQPPRASQPNISPVRIAPAASPAPAPSATVSAQPQVPTSPLGPILSVFANKGGVGKTTLSINIAVTLARRGQHVVLVDADPRNDVGNALMSRKDYTRGLFDVIDGSCSLNDALLTTALPNLSVLPAGGEALSEEKFAAASARQDRIAAILMSLSRVGGIVVVDTPPGLRGIPNAVLSASTHALVVVQAEPVAMRAAAAVVRHLDGMPSTRRPALAGVVLNMFDRRVGSSLGTLEDACRIFGAEQVFDIPIPRSGVFLEASEQGVPVALMQDAAGPAVGWIFESLGTSLLSKMTLAAPKLADLRLL